MKYIWNLSSDGSESGQYLALDLGGTNFRVIKLQLENGRITDETIDYFSVEEHFRFVLKNHESWLHDMSIYTVDWGQEPTSSYS